MQPQVWARALWLALDIAESGGLDVEAICAGLSFDRATSRKRRLVDWDEFCICVERMEAAAGGPAGIRALTKAHYYDGIPELKKIAGMFVTPKTLLRFIYETANPIIYPMIGFKFEAIDDQVMRMENWLQEGVRPCSAFFRGTTGALESFPTVLGLAEATVKETITDSYASWEVTLPVRVKRRDAAKEISLSALSRLVRIALGNDGEGHQWQAQVAWSDTGVDARIELSTAAWNLTPRHGDILRLIAQGKSNKEIGALLACAESTVERHVTHILERSGSSSRAVLIARFWSEL